jgi:uncharacterized membrane protein
MELVVHKNGRIDVLDAIRGAAIISMVVYHALYDVCDIFKVYVRIFDVFTAWEPWFAGAFILLCGMSCRFSHNNLKRGLRVFAVAMAVTLVTVLFSVFVSPGQEIYFGILHFMGVAILLYIPLRSAADKIKPVPALIIYTALFVLTYNLPTAYIIGIPGLFGINLPYTLLTASQTFSAFLGGVFHTRMPEWFASVVGLYPLGIPGADFKSADYFPLIPWFFLFLAGTVLGVPVKEHKLPDGFYTAKVPFLAAAGRNTLLIYVLHQPVVYAVLLAVMAVIHH